MRIGQTAFVTFISNVLASAIGFVGTIYFARILGAEVIGIYSLVLAVVAWASIPSDAGVPMALSKRLSEGQDRARFFTAGFLLMLATYTALSVAMYAFKGPIESYLGSPVIWFVILILFAGLVDALATSVLTGHHLVHVEGLLMPVRITTRNVIQIVLVFAGFGLSGLLAGYVVGFVLVGVIGLLIVAPTLSLPSWHHFESLVTYAKYSWLGAVQSRTFGWVDVTVLGFFVSSGLIGVYSVSWMIGTFLLASGSAISSAIFPEISSISSNEGEEAAVPVIRDAMTYAGIFLIPGLVGSVILARRILRIYGPTFTRGTTVLVILVSACLVYGYLRQIVSALNGVDRPELTFRIYATFIGTNVVLNVVLIYLIGWVGAAIATAVSAAIGLAVAYYYLRSVVPVSAPLGEVGKQWVAALVMGVIVYVGLQVENTYQVLSHNFFTVIVLVSLGAGVYFVTLYGLSEQFRATIRTNLPFEVPGLS